MVKLPKIGLPNAIKPEKVSGVGSKQTEPSVMSQADSCRPTDEYLRSLVDRLKKRPSARLEIIGGPNERRDWIQEAHVPYRNGDNIDSWWDAKVATNRVFAFSEVARHPSQYSWLPEQHRLDPVIASLAVNNDGMMIRYVPTELDGNRRLM